MNKKAISPLIAAVLLVVVVVSLGAAVMSLTRGYLEQGETDVNVNKESIRCGRDVGIQFAIINENYAVCNKTDPDDSDMAQTQLYIENVGTMDVLDAQVRLIGKTSIFQNDTVLSNTLETGSIARINVTYDPESLGEFRQLKITPRINLPGITDHAYCSDAALTISSLSNNCTTYE